MRALPLVPLVGLSLLAAGCAHLQPPSLTCADEAPARWSELSSPHFVLRTDLPRARAREALVAFEQGYAAFEEIAFPGPRRAGEPIDFVLFAREADFRRIAPAGATGFFLSHPNDDLDGTPTIAMHGEVLQTTQRRFQHELTHRFLSYHLRAAPPWLEEGLAEYWSTLRVDGDEAILGELPVAKVVATELHTGGALSERLVEQRVLLEEIPPLAQVLSADEATFHDPRREVAFYAASWALVHLLVNGPDRETFRSYVDQLADGKRPDQAWLATFGAGSETRVADLDREFRRYLLRAELRSSRRAYSPPKVAHPIVERALVDAEVHLLLARVRPWNCRENIVRAGVDLRRAVAGAPASPEVMYWKALYDRRWRRFEEAETDLRRALAARPDEPRYWHALADLRHGVAADEPERARGLGDVDEAVRHLQLVARSPWALDFIARYYGERGALDPALRYARRAVEAEPGCWECADTYASLLEAKGVSAPNAPRRIDESLDSRRDAPGREGSLGDLLAPRLPAPPRRDVL